MARDHARLLCAVWGDKDWIDRTGEAQRLYMLLISQADISYAGVLPYRPRRWARLAKDTSLAKIRRAHSELEHHGYVVTDLSTEETAVRTFIHHDKVLRVPNVARAMVKAYRQILSPHLQDVLLSELARLHRSSTDSAENKGWEIVMLPAASGGMREDVEAALSGRDR